MMTIKIEPSPLPGLGKLPISTNRHRSRHPSIRYHILLVDGGYLADTNLVARHEEK
jgi:hypothetical protein